MDSLLIQVAIGLVLIYLVVALLQTKLQEMLHGQWRRGRVQNMHRMLLEATGRDEALKKRVLENPLLFSLSEGNETARMGGLRRPTGPSAIPPDLFAKALLMALNPTGQAPSTGALLPAAFMDQLLKNTDPGVNPDKFRYLTALRGLVPAATSGWAAFETAIALWFSDIGDRADGWYQRQSNWVGLWLAFALCVVLNVDTANIVNTLGADPELRQSLGDLADLALQTRGDGSKNAASSPAPDPALDPATRAVARLVDANAFVSEAYFKDKAITRFGYYMTKASDVCPHEVVPGPSAAASEGTYVSNSDTWVSILPALLPTIEQSINRLNDDADVPEQLRTAYKCLSNVSAWVRAASTSSNVADTRRVMVEAGKALDDSKAALLSLLRSNEVQGGLRRLFRFDPEAFQRCAGNPAANPSNMQACVLREQDLLNRLPIGHTPSNWRQQFCRVQTLDPDDRLGKPLPRTNIAIVAPVASQVAVSVTNEAPKASGPTAHAIERGWFTQNICTEVVLPEQPKLRISGMTLVLNPGGLGFAFVGLLISTIFVALGAPVVFDLLGKLVKMRTAGEVRDASKSQLTGGGTMALPMLVTQQDEAATQVANAIRTSTSGTLPDVEGANAGFEQGLTPREMQAVKQRLGIQPSTGGFDDKTRAAIKTATGADTLTQASYLSLMGRLPVQAAATAAPLPSGTVSVGQPLPQAPALAGNLNAELNFTGRVPSTVSTLTQELRALVVLYRYSIDANKSPTAAIFNAANTNPGLLDTIDTTLSNKILGVGAANYPRRQSAPWLDVALGELGQVELGGSMRSTSNPRVIEYLDAVGTSLGDQGDQLAWCACFVTWVLKHPFAMGSTAQPLAASTISGTWTVLSNGLSIPTNIPEHAANWAQWPRPHAAAGSVAPVGGNPPPLEGDVVVVDTGGANRHVGFVYLLDPDKTHFWLLGGNQRAKGCVSLSRWPLASIA